MKRAKKKSGISARRIFRQQRDAFTRRLRKLARSQHDPNDRRLILQAADEIEQLRVEKLKALGAVKLMELLPSRSRRSASAEVVP